MLGTDIVLSLLHAPVVPFLESPDPPAADGDDPACCSRLLVFFWSIDINAFVFSRALERPYLLCVAIIVGYALLMRQPANHVAPAGALMRVHILGVCGTFMGGIAAIAKEAGHDVSGADQNVYPPMSTQLAALGIRLVEGYEAPIDAGVDSVVVGNALSRGKPVVEALLNSGRPYSSGPQWLAEHVLRDKWVLAVVRHARQDDDDEHAGVDPRVRGARTPASSSAASRATSASRRGSAARSTSSSKPTSTTRRSSTSAPSSSTTGRAR